MAGNLARINLREAGEAVWQFLEDEALVHQELADELSDRNRGLWRDYSSHQHSLWSRLLGRLREAGMDAPEMLISSGILAVVGVGLSVFLSNRRR